MSLNFVEKNFILNGNSTANNTLIFYKRGFELGGAPEPTWQDVILSGNTALTLVNAKADGLNYVKLFGECEQKTLPNGYTALEYIQSSGTQYINTDIQGEAKVVIDCQGVSSSSTSEIIIGSYTYPPSFFGQAGSTGKYGFNANALTDVDYTTRKTFTINFNDDATVQYDSTTIQYTDSGTLYTSANYALFRAMARSASNYYYAKARIYSVTFEQNGVYVAKMYPAKRDSDNALGMYDTVRNTFYTNAGTGAFIAGDEITPTPTPTPSTPLYIVCNNGVLKYGQYGKNLFDKSTADTNRIYGYFPSSGTTWYYASAGFSVRIPCLPNTTYTARYNGNSTQAVLGFGSTGSDSTPQPPNGNATVSQAIRQNDPTKNTPITITTKANDKWLIVAYNVSDPQHTDMADNLQIEIGSTATEYEPYHFGLYIDGTTETVKDSLDNTATAEMLLKVGKYQDVQSVLDGDIIRKVGVVVFDGTENWGYDANYERFSLSISDLIQGLSNRKMPLICTHYPVISDGRSIANVPYNSIYGTNTNNVFIKTADYNTVAGFTTFLAQQYSNGTPVILVYPLNNSTTEQVTGQVLTIQQGTNIIEITQASIDGLPLEVSYKAGVTVTVEEIENANLDNSVTVTIGE